MGKKLIPVFVVIALVAVIGGAYFLLKDDSSTEENSTDSTTQESSLDNSDSTLNEESAEKAAKEYWEAVKFNDHKAKYALMCDSVKKQISESDYVSKYENDPDQSLTEITKYEIGDATLDGTTATIRTTLYTLVYSDGVSDMTELKYENGSWCKELSSDTLDWLLE